MITILGVPGVINKKRRICKYKKYSNGRSIFEDSPKKPGAKDGKIGLSRKRQYHNHQDFH